MKRRYERPSAYFETFAANEYVAACYSLYCEVAGDNLKYTRDTYFNNDVTWDGKRVVHDGLLHGRPCAEKSSYNDTTKTFMENKKASKIDSIEILSPAGNGRYYAVWGSDDVNKTGYYKHYGWAVLDDKNRPNHS
ncbi:Uncharacterised protein [uncultured Eubacterium sp.]|nr:Uncharacterised protein [uncultured Eubacterium sp.]